MAKKLMAEQSQFTRLDRDLLIRLDTKVDLLQNSVKDLADGTQLRLAKLETKHEADNAKIVARLDAMDIYHAKIDLARYEALAKWVEKLKANVALVVGVALFFNGVVSAIVLSLIRHFFGL